MDLRPYLPVKQYKKKCLPSQMQKRPNTQNLKEKDEMKTYKNQQSCSEIKPRPSSKLG